MEIREEIIDNVTYFNVYQNDKCLYRGKDIDDASQFISSWVEDE